MSDKVKELINSLGVMSEICGILRDQLIANGFTRTEAITLCQTCLRSMVTAPNNSNNE